MTNEHRRPKIGGTGRRSRHPGERLLRGSPHKLVRDPVTLEPAAEETAAICDRILELGVVIQPTGDHQNILKTKLPLCLDVGDADFDVAALGGVLTEGW